MNEYVKKYRKVVNELISKSFPSLKKKRFKIFEFGVINLYGAYLPGNFIGASKKCRVLSKDKIKGLLAHELSHAEYSNKIGCLKSCLIFILYWFFPKLRMKIEIDNDKKAIRKGYAKELFKITKLIELELREDYMKYGLSSGKIKSYAKKIGKWQRS